MPKISLPALLLPVSLSVLAGCASQTTAHIIPTPIAAYPVLSGNWAIPSLNYTNANLPGPINSFTGTLTSIGGVVSGTLHATPFLTSTPCVSPSQDLLVSGTVDSSGNLKLTTPIAGGTAAITATLTSNLQAHTTLASYQITGGTCAQAATNAFIEQVAPATGAFTGTVKTLAGITASATVNLTQHTTADVDGLYPLDGTVTVTGTTCDVNSSFTGGTLTGFSVNQLYESNYQTNDASLTGSIQTDNLTFYAILTPANRFTNCTFFGTLTRQ